MDPDARRLRQTLVDLDQDSSRMALWLSTEAPRCGLGMARRPRQGLRRGRVKLCSASVLGFSGSFSLSTPDMVLGLRRPRPGLVEVELGPESGWLGLLDQLCSTKVLGHGLSMSSRFYSMSSSLGSQTCSAALTLDFCSGFPSFSDLL